MDGCNGIQLAWKPGANERRVIFQKKTFIMQITFPGDSAFATPANKIEMAREGLTKREYFASMAMQGLLSAIPTGKLTPEVAKQIGIAAVEMADGLTSALNKDSL